MPAAPSARHRILDAAHECFVEAGPSATTHSGIAERAGVSRPTVYKHVGDLRAIARALLERELTVFIDRLREEIGALPTASSQLTRALVFTVEYTSAHRLLQRLLTQEPMLVLPFLTTESGPYLATIAEALVPYVEAAVDRGELAHDEATDVLDWLIRLGASLVMNPTDRRGAELDAYVGAFVRRVLG